MKTLTATAGDRRNPITVNVQISGVDENETLTPKLARRAARVAFGHTNGVTVRDSEAGVGYRLTRSRARKFYEYNW